MTQQLIRKQDRQSRKKIGWIALMMLIIAGFLGLYFYPKRPDQLMVLQVNEEQISVSEAMIYHRLMQRQFEIMASEEIWNLDILGLDPLQTEMERVLESIIRVKAIQPAAGVINEREKADLNRKADQLEQFLGTSYMQEHCIERALIEKVVAENYLAYRYEKKATFLPGSNEEDINDKMNDIFARYDHLNVEQYTRSVTLMPMMFFTGEWVEGEWVSYPEAQKAVILDKVQKVYDNLDPDNFKRFAEEYADSVELEKNPVFEEGVVQNPNMNFGSVYFGQMKQEVAEIIWGTKMNSVSQLIETEYGYLVVKVVSFLPSGQNDAAIYEAGLNDMKTQYRSRVIEELKGQRMQEEWQRLEQECAIVRFDQVWEDYVEQVA